MLAQKHRFGFDACTQTYLTMAEPGAQLWRFLLRVAPFSATDKNELAFRVVRAEFVDRSESKIAMYPEKKDAFPGIRERTLQYE